MNRFLLKDIADIQTGYSFRTGVEPDEDGSTRVIQMRDLGDDGTVQSDSLLHVDVDVPDVQQVAVGDIVFRARGVSMSSAIVAEALGDAVVAAPLLRVRVTDAKVLPDYVNWYINQPVVQAYLTMNAEGTNVKMISKGALQDMKIVIPPLKRQEKIVELAALNARGRVLERELADLRNRLMTHTMMDYAERGI